MDKTRIPPDKENCWVCGGSGRVSGLVLGDCCECNATGQLPKGTYAAKKAEWSADFTRVSALLHKPIDQVLLIMLGVPNIPDTAANDGSEPTSVRDQPLSDFAREVIAMAYVRVLDGRSLDEESWDTVERILEIASYDPALDTMLTDVEEHLHREIVQKMHDKLN